MPDAEAKFSADDKRLILRESTVAALKRGDPRARWTVAHELGHVVSRHPGTNRRGAATPKAGLKDRILESEANRFAAAFLAPYHLTELSPDTTERHIAIRFRISPEAARTRLAEFKRQSSRFETMEQDELTASQWGEVSAPPLSPPSGEALYGPIRELLEQNHFGSYVMINTDTAEYVIEPTTSQVHAEFIGRFGEEAPGWCTRIGTSVFVTA